MAGSLRVCVIVLLIYGGLLGATSVGIMKTPVGFIPNQDKGYLIVNIPLPDSASLERTVEVVKRVEKIAKEIEGVAHTIGIPGQSFVLNAVNSNFGSMFVIFDEFDHRQGLEKYSATIGQKIRQRCFDEILDAQIAVFGAPPVDGLGNAGGFKLMIEDLSGGELAALQAAVDAVAAKGNEQPGLVGLFNSFRSNTPQLYIDVDRVKCKSMFHQDINIFVQVGFIVLVGLAAKNAILIVETARHKKSTGESRFDAAVNASTSRLRPIIMTSFAFILGVVPLMISHGAGFEMRRTLGVAVFFGMLGVTGFGIFLTPVFYYVIDWLAERNTPEK